MRDFLRLRLLVPFLPVRRLLVPALFFVPRLERRRRRAPPSSDDGEPKDELIREPIPIIFLYILIKDKNILNAVQRRRVILSVLLLLFLLSVLLLLFVLLVLLVFIVPANLGLADDERTERTGFTRTYPNFPFLAP